MYIEGALMSKYRNIALNVPLRQSRSNLFPSSILFLAHMKSIELACSCLWCDCNLYKTWRANPGYGGHLWKALGVRSYTAKCPFSYSEWFWSEEDSTPVHVVMHCSTQHASVSSSTVHEHSACNSKNKIWFFTILKPYFCHKNVRQFQITFTNWYRHLWSYVPSRKKWTCL